MSNNWSYTLFFANRLTDPAIDPANTFHSVIDALGLLGYSLRPSITIGNLRSHREIEFSNYSAAATYLYAEGGAFEVSRSCESCEDLLSLKFYMDFTPAFKTIEAGSTYFLYEDDWSRIELAHDLRKLWQILAKRLKPIYGYGASGYEREFTFAKEKIIGATDSITAEESFYQTISEYKTPPVIFGQNYFDPFYYDQLDEKIFSEIPHRKYILPDKYVGIYISEFPWNSNVAVLGIDGIYHIPGKG